MEVFKTNPTKYVIFIFDRLVDYDDYNDDLLRIIMLNMRMIALREKCPNTEFFLVRFFPHSDWIRRDTPYLSVFSPNAEKYGPEKTSYLGTLHAA